MPQHDPAPAPGTAPQQPQDLQALRRDIEACRLCQGRFAATATQHHPRPVVWLSAQARILICGQAPGARVHASGRPFSDASGDRLRQWMGVSDAEFYDLKRIAILPQAFCFPGYNSKGRDLPPPALCARSWHDQVLTHLPQVRLKLLVGGYAQNWHLQGKGSVTQRVREWRKAPAGVVPLPHPSWRNTAWLKRHPWFETDLLPQLRAKVRQVLNQGC